MPLCLPCACLQVAPGADAETAAFFLEAAAWSLADAVATFYEQGGGTARLWQPHTAPQAGPLRPCWPTPSGPAPVSRPFVPLVLLVSLLSRTADSYKIVVQHQEWTEAGRPPE